MDNLFDNMLKATKNMYASKAIDGIVGDISGYVTSGSYMFDALMSGKIVGGGFARGKITCLAGESGVGKTFIILSTLKIFLDDNPGGAAFLFESESAITRDMMIARGIDIRRVIVIPVNTIEDWRNQCVAILEVYNTDCHASKVAHEGKMAKFRDDNKKIEKANKKIKDEKDKTPLHVITEWENTRPIFMALDSVGNLSTLAEVNNAIEGKTTQVMSREKVLKGACRVITTRLSLFQIPFVMSAHIYMTMETYSKTIMSGGSGPKYTSSITVFMFKNKITIGPDKAKVHVGNNVRCVIDKGRLTKEGSTSWCQILFASGLNPYYGLVSPGVEMGLIQQSGSWFEFPNGLRCQGEAQIYAQAKDVFTPEYIASLQPWVTDKYCYGEGEAIPIDDLLEDSDAVELTVNSFENAMTGIEVSEESTPIAMEQ